MKRRCSAIPASKKKKFQLNSVKNGSKGPDATTCRSTTWQVSGKERRGGEKRFDVSVGTNLGVKAWGSKGLVAQGHQEQKRTGGKLFAGGKRQKVISGVCVV